MRIVDTDYSNSYIMIEFQADTNHPITLVVRLNNYKTITEYYTEDEVKPSEHGDLISYLKDYFTGDEQSAIVSTRNSLEMILKTEGN